MGVKMEIKGIQENYYEVSNLVYKSYYLQRYLPILRFKIRSFFLSFFLPFFFRYLPFTNLEFTLPGLNTQMPVGQMPVGRAIIYGAEHKTNTKGRASLNGNEHNVRASAGDST